MSILQIPTARIFRPLLEPARDKVALGGRGSGKSHFFAGLMVEDCLAEPGETGGEGLRCVCIREVQKDLAQSSKALIETKLRSLNLGEADGFKIYRDVIATPGDGIIIFCCRPGSRPAPISTRQSRRTSTMRWHGRSTAAAPIS